jgi:CHASE3 domain sensor protein
MCEYVIIPFIFMTLLCIVLHSYILYLWRRISDSERRNKRLQASLASILDDINKLNDSETDHE